MVFTRKFSQFVQGGQIQTGDMPVGLEADANTIWDFTGVNINSVTQIITQDTSALAVGRWVRIDNTGLYVHGLATSAENAEIEGVVKEILSPTQFVLQQSGYIDHGTPGFSGFAFNNIYFLSDTLLGEQTLIEPTTNGYVSKPLFAADSADSGWVICLSRGYIIGSPGPIPAGGGTASDSNIHDVNQPGNTFMIGQWVRVFADNTYALADSTNLPNSQSVGVVIAAGDPVFTIQFAGWNSATVTTAVDSVGAPLAIVASTVYYLSDVVPGAITPTPPTAVNTSNKPVFISESALNGTGWVLPQRPIQNTSNSGGGIIQVQSTLVRVNATTASTTNTWTTIPAFSVTITPGSIASQIKISASFQFSHLVAGVAVTAPTAFRILRNSVLIPDCIGTGGALPCTVSYAASSGAEEANILFIDSPASVAALTYEFQFLVSRPPAGTPMTFLLNGGDATGSTFNGVAQFICEEIA